MIDLQSIRSKTHASASKRGLLSSLGMGALLIASASFFSSVTNADVNTTGLAVTDDTVTVGILHSLTGTMAISETTLKDTMLMLIEDQNRNGGLLGKQLEAVVVDPASDWPLFAEKARQLITQDKVAAPFGCWTSVSRKSVLPVVEQNNGLLFYPLHFEGEENSKNVVYMNSPPSSSLLPAVDYLMSPDGGNAKRFYMLGSDPQKLVPTDAINATSFSVARSSLQGPSFTRYLYA